MTFPQPLAFEWDAGNKEKNWVKNSVHYKDIEEVFFNTPLLTFADARHSKTEKRYFALGITNAGVQLTVIFTIRKKLVRVISARNQHRKEKALYEKKQ